MVYSIENVSVSATVLVKPSVATTRTVTRSPGSNCVRSMDASGLVRPTATVCHVCLSSVLTCTLYVIFDVSISVAALSHANERADSLDASWRKFEISARPRPSGRYQTLARYRAVQSVAPPDSLG